MVDLIDREARLNREDSAVRPDLLGHKTERSAELLVAIVRLGQKTVCSWLQSMLSQKVSSKNPDTLTVVINLKVVSGMFEQISFGDFLLQLGNCSVLFLSLEKIG